MWIPLLSLVLLMAPADMQPIQVQAKTQIPGTTLEPGTYTFSLEDQLKDRAIVRVAKQDGSSHELVLAVPSPKLSASGPGLIFFDDQHTAVRGWKAPSTSIPFEFVYPKDQAVSVMGSTTKPVMAVDPSYDKLPANLSPDDMKVVTLWLLNPKQITPDGKVNGVQPIKLAQAMRPKMPKTASHDVEYAIAGGGMLLAGLALLSKR